MDKSQYIREVMEEQGITQAELARKIGISRQGIWDTLDRKNPNFATIRTIFNALGLEIAVKRMDGKPLDFDMNELFNVLKEDIVGYERVESILNVIGYKLEVVDK
uniref:Helix-turn-helix XRE-family like protein n=1 Tax=Siphoviridae sp. ctVOP12 TaxID=2825531 RepID=A0A8S5V9Z1_9CAUD|nr:MAG TPA: Helix-turn-helix XRE-family like protein [Siphoviridae sp. ctVOP12]